MLTSSSSFILAGLPVPSGYENQEIRERGKYLEGELRLLTTKKYYKEFNVVMFISNNINVEHLFIGHGSSLVLLVFKCH